LIAPTEAPTTKSGNKPEANKTRTMPTCMAPRLPPPVKTNAVFRPVIATKNALPQALDAFQSRRFPGAHAQNGAFRYAVFFTARAVSPRKIPGALLSGCSPDERSEIRDGHSSSQAAPGFHFVHPGYIG
jgi:hypothetical protein